MNAEKQNQQLRLPIVTVCGHVDHGKTSLLDAFRSSCFQEQEAGGITQKISFTLYPAKQIKAVCPLICREKAKLEIPGFLFIDTPGHAAFTNLRKRGGALADLAILVVSIKEGIKPQTAEVLQILKANKTPFVVALNKIDAISGWSKHEGINLRDSIESQADHTKQEFDEALLTFQGSLKEHGFDSELYFKIDDFTKKIAIVPCSARNKDGISELIFILCGLCQKFLKERLKISDIAKGIVLEIKKNKSMEYAEAILHDGSLDEGDEIVVATFGEPVVTKVRAIQEIEPLSCKYKPTKKVVAASGIKMQLANNEGILAGMPFQKVIGDLEQSKAQFRKEMSGVLEFDKQGIIIKADSLGSLEALITLLKQENIQIINGGIGPIGKYDISSAKANLAINPLDAVIVGFNVETEKDIDTSGAKVFTDKVIYKLIENLQEWRKKKQEEIEKEKLLGLATICKLEILHKYVFRNSNPAIFGVKVIGGRLKIGIPLVDENGKEIARVKSMQVDKVSVDEATEGQEVALALPGIAFDRQLGKSKFLYASLSESQLKQLKKNEELLSLQERKIICEVEEIRIKKEA